MVVASDGSIYFTDPPGGRMAAWGVERAQELKFMGVFRYPPDGGELQLVGEFAFPNGLCLSPGESLLYVDETTEQRILALDLAPDGTTANRRIFAEGIGPTDLGTVDGMRCDEHGNVWVTGPRAIWVYSPEGTRLGGIPSPIAPSTCTGAAPTGRGSSSPARPGSIESRRWCGRTGSRSWRGANPARQS